MSNNIGYQLRLSRDDSKIVGGCFGGSIDMETVNRIVRSHLTIAITNSGRAVFISKGREVRLLLNIDASSTDEGIKELAIYKEEKRVAEKAEMVIREKQEAEIAALMDNLTNDDIISRLQPIIKEVMK